MASNKEEILADIIRKPRFSVPPAEERRSCRNIQRLTSTASHKMSKAYCETGRHMQRSVLGGRRNPTAPLAVLFVIRLLYTSKMLRPFQVLDALVQNHVSTPLQCFHGASQHLRQDEEKTKENIMLSYIQNLRGSDFRKKIQSRQTNSCGMLRENPIRRAELRSSLNVKNCPKVESIQK